MTDLVDDSKKNYGLDTNNFRIFFCTMRNKFNDMCPMRTEKKEKKLIRITEFGTIFKKKTRTSDKQYYQLQINDLTKTIIVVHRS